MKNHLAIMTAEEQKGDGQNTVPMEGEDISIKKDGGVLKVFSCLPKRSSWSIFLLVVLAGYVVGRAKASLHNACTLYKSSQAD